MSVPSSDREPWRRRLWPIAPALLLTAGVSAGFAVDSWEASTVTVLLAVVIPLALSIVATGVSIGRRRGLVIAGLLVGLAAYWSWWFGWGVDATISPFSVRMAATGLADAATYVLALLVNLWPFVLGAAVLVGLVARRRGHRAWNALGVLALTLVVLSFPVRATWSDSCNDTTGAAPLITRPITQPLMDRGIGVLPGGSQTLVGCFGTGDREWKPFWRGDDQLPPGPAIYGSVGASIRVPKRLYRTPAPLPDRRLDRVALAYWPEREELYAVIATDAELATAPPTSWPPVEFSIGGVPFDDDEGLADRGTNGWCYSVVWVRNPDLPAHRGGERLRVDLEYRGRRLASARATVEVLQTDEQIRRMGNRFGCPLMW